jgi:LysM repeat protein
VAGQPVSHVVVPGDTIWSIARGLVPEGDIRPVVDRIVAANGGSGLEVGQVLLIPTRG